MSFNVSGHYIHCVYTSTDLITYLHTYLLTFSMEQSPS